MSKILSAKYYQESKQKLKKNKQKKRCVKDILIFLK